MSSKKVSGKTHTKNQLNNWANQNNPNNKAYRANNANKANQMNQNRKTHRLAHNADRRNRTYLIPDWSPDYPEYDD